MMLVTLPMLGLWGKEQVWEEIMTWDFMGIWFSFLYSVIGNTTESFIGYLALPYNHWLEMKSSLIPSVLGKYMNPVTLISKFPFACLEKETSLLMPKCKHCRPISSFYKACWEVRVAKEHAKWELKETTQDMSFLLWVPIFSYKLWHMGHAQI